VFVDKANFWNEDKRINGFGFKGKEIYRVTIIFKNDTTSFYGITIERIKKSILSNKSIIDAINQISYSAIETLSNDSLNLKSRTNSYTDISDSSEWTFLIIKNNIIILKQSYAPETYQKIAPTKERQIFMETLGLLDKLLK
jgi:hypothetical protein